MTRQREGSARDRSVRPAGRGRATASDLRLSLVRRARAHAAARASAEAGVDAGPDPVAIWDALVSGRLSVIGHFALGGRRVLVLQAAPPGGTPGGLSRRELLVCFLAARGHSNAHVGWELDVAPSTVATYLAKAMAKLGVTSRVELVRLFSSTRAKRRTRGAAALA